MGAIRFPAGPVAEGRTVCSGDLRKAWPQPARTVPAHQVVVRRVGSVGCQSQALKCSKLIDILAGLRGDVKGVTQPPQVDDGKALTLDPVAFTASPCRPTGPRPAI